MKYLLLIALSASLVLAGNQSHANDITLTAINNWTLPQKAFGLDVYGEPGSMVIMGADCITDNIFLYSASTGMPTGEQIDLHADNGAIFAVVWNNDPTAPELYTNDWLNPALFHTINMGTSWTSLPNPESAFGRGMDFDGTDYWMAAGSFNPTLLRFFPGGDQELFQTTEIPDQSSGLTVFPYQGNTMIAITAYATHSVFFYLWDGSSLNYHGSTACPASNINLSLGLACAGADGNLFWSYIDTSDNSHLVEMTLGTMSLNHHSWGSIKNSF